MHPATLSQIARRDLLTFNEKTFRLLNPGTKFEDNWHLHAIAKALDDMLTGECRRLIITMPPRTLKSSTVSVAWPAFLLGQDPTTRIIVASYAENLANKLSDDCGRVMTSTFFTATFKKTVLRKNVKLSLETTQGGTRMGTSVGGSITGLGANWIILDDPHNASEAYSPTAREMVKRYYSQTLSTRFDDPTTGRIILVMQRLHEDDLAGHLLAQGGWRHLKLQARATEDRLVELGQGRLRTVKTGDFLHEQRLPQSVLDQAQRDMTSVNFQAQYQQDPVPASGNMIKADWLRYYDRPPSLDGGQITLSLDTATKTGSANDYSACAVWLSKEGEHFVIGNWRDKVDFPTLREKIIGLNDVWKPTAILIEDNQTGTALIQELSKIDLPVVGVVSKETKESRLNSASVYISSGKMLLPKDAPWLAEFESELLAFPHGRHDDQVDSVSLYFNWVRNRPKPGFFNYEFM